MPSFFTLLRGAFHKLDVYTAYIRKGEGTGLKYLFLLLLLGWFLIALKDMAVIASVKPDDEESVWVQPSTFFQQLAEHVPGIVIDQGQLQVEDILMPYEITDPKTGITLIAIDATGQWMSFAETDALMLLTERAVLLRLPGNQVERIDIPENLNLELTKMDLYNMAEMSDAFMIWVPIITVPFYVAIAWLGFALEALLFAFGIMIWTKSREEAKKLPKGGALSFEASMRLACLALTPAMVMKMAMVFFHFQPFLFPELVTLVLTGVYVWMVLQKLEIRN